MAILLGDSGRLGMSRREYSEVIISSRSLRHDLDGSSHFYKPLLGLLSWWRLHLKNVLVYKRIGYIKNFDGIHELVFFEQWKWGMKVPNRNAIWQFIEPWLDICQILIRRTFTLFTFISACRRSSKSDIKRKYTDC